MFVVNGISCLLNIGSCLVFHAFALREELAQKTVAVFICASFPRRIRMGKVDPAILNFSHVRKLRTVVKGNSFEPIRMLVYFLLKQPLTSACSIIRYFDNNFKTGSSFSQSH